jgi:hypothetical protein
MKMADYLKKLSHLHEDEKDIQVFNKIAGVLIQYSANGMLATDMYIASRKVYDMLVDEGVRISPPVFDENKQSYTLSWD